MFDRNDDRRSPLALAARNNEMRVLNVLLHNNADVNGRDKDHVSTNNSLKKVSPPGVVSDMDHVHSFRIHSC